MRKERLLFLFTVLLLSALTLAACKRQEAEGLSKDIIVTVYKSPTCGCCGGWIEHMRKAGFEVREVNVSSSVLLRVKDKYGVPYELRSCHTAVVGDYIVEGHVPPQEVQRLLAERPAVKGIGVPGMPLGSPGMESPDGTVQPYTVFAFDQAGNMQPVAQYP